MRKLIRKILKGASLTTALFIFEACYGTGYYEGKECENYIFSVVSKDDNSPIPGVDILSRPFKSDFLDWSQCGVTQLDGMASVCVETLDGQLPEFRFLTADGMFESKDTVIVRKSDAEIVIKLSKKIEEE